MEPGVEVELLRKVRKRGVGVSAIATDNDSSTIKKCRDEMDPNLQKHIDVGHTTKNLKAHVETISSRHQGVTQKVGHFEKCFICAVKQNEGKPADVKKALLNVVSHSYGEHQSCGEWCGYLRNPERYKHTTLPYGRDLTDLKLKKDLNKIFKNFADRSEELTPSGSTQANEAINNIVGSKPPKVRHYGDSESSDFRCAAAVCQKNEGYSFIYSGCSAEAWHQNLSVCLQHRMKLQNAKQQYFNYDRCRSEIAISFSICSLLILSSA